MDTPYRVAMVAAITKDFVRVDYFDDKREIQSEYLMGLARPRNVLLGDFGQLAYRRMGSLAMYIFINERQAV